MKIMPTIPKTKDTNKKYMRSRAVEPKRNIADTEQQKYFNTRRYKDFRRIMLMRHPCCELSLLDNHVVEANHVHHLIKWFEQPTEELRWQLLLDEDNIICLAYYKHQHIHYAQDRLSDEEKEYIKSRKDKVFAKYLKDGILLNYTEDRNHGKFFGDRK